MLLLRFSAFHPSRLFSIPTPSQTRSPRLHLKPAATPFPALTFVRNFRWRTWNVGFASMAFSAGNGGGAGNSDDASGKGDDDGDDDGDDSTPAGSCRSPPEDKEQATALLFGLWKLFKTIYRVCNWNCASTLPLPTEDIIVHHFLWLLVWPFTIFITAFSEILFATMWIILLGSLFMGILAVAFCVFLCLYFTRQLSRHYELGNTSNPPADTECCICLSTREGRAAWRSLPCNHWFHTPCINSWIQINPTCPICKQDA